MKKIALFAAAMMICAGMAFAQSPVKKTDNTKAKTETKQDVKKDAQVQQPNAQAKHCGNCPNHAKAANASTLAPKPECKKNDAGCCKKDCKKQENNATKKENDSKAAVKK